MNIVRRGDIFLTQLDAQGSQQGGVRPVLIVQNDTGNKYSPCTIVVPLTSRVKKLVPTHVLIAESDGVDKPSVALCEQISTIDKTRLKKKLGQISNVKIIAEINKKIMVSLGL